MSRQERASWVLLVLNLIVGVWYFSTVFAMGPDISLHGPLMAMLIAQITIVAIVIAIVGHIVMLVLAGKPQDRVEQDERDNTISLKACRNGYFVLVGSVISLMVALVVATGLTHRTPSPPPDLVTGFLGAMGEAVFTANLLLCALVITEIAIQGSRIFYYRRGY